MEKDVVPFWKIIIALFFLSGEAPLSAQQEAVLTGKADDSVAPLIGFSFSNNPFTLETVYYDAPIDAATGVFAIKLRLKQPAVVFARYKEAVFKMYISGGDTVRLRFNGAHPAETVVFEGSGAAQNAYLTQSVAQDKDWADDAALSDSLLNYSSVDYQRYIGRRYQLKKDFLRQYAAAEKSKFAPGFSAYIEADVEYWRAYALLLYYQKFGLSRADPGRRIPPDDVDFLTLLDPLTSEALENPYYLRFLDLWLIYRQEKESGAPPKIETDVVQQKDELVRYATAAVRLNMAATPQTPDVVAGTLAPGEKTEYLNVHTAEMYPYKMHGTKYYDQFYKVRTADGTAGWVPYFGVGFSDEVVPKIVTRERVCFDSLSPTCGFERFIPKDQKSLYFLAAKNLLLPFAASAERQINEAVGRFEAANSPYPEYLAAVKETARLTLEAREIEKFRLTIPDYCSIEPFLVNATSSEALARMRTRVFAEPVPVPPPASGPPEQAASPSAFISTQSDDFKGLKMNDPAPGFVAKDAGGKEIALSDYAGKVVYLDFWASWCGPCKEHIKYTQRLWNDKYKQKNAVFIYCSIDKSEADWKSFIEENRLSGVLCREDAARPVQEKYSVKRLPNYFLIDRKGKIQLNSLLHGEVSLEDALDALLQ